MALTSKSPKAVVLAALATARRALPEHAHRFSPKKFTQHQLFACLVLKNFLRTDYRGLAAQLKDHPSLLAILELKQVPHFTTFQKASRRLLLTGPARRLLETTVRLHLGRRRRVKRAAIDSTGLECSCASGYFVRRRNRVSEAWKTVVYHHYPKLGVVCDGDCHFILAGQAGRGPRPDVDEFRPLLAEALRIVCLSQLAADAGYDSEPNHRFARDEHGIRTIIPAKHGRPTDKLPTGRYRRLMKVRFDRPAYRRRSQVETVISMIKRRQGAHVHGRSYHSQCRDLRLLVLTHNVMILVLVQVFYRAFPSPLIILRNRNIDMGLFGPPKTKITPHDFVKAQLDETFSDQFIQAETNEFLRLSRENPLFRDVTLELYLKERRNVVCNLFEIAWCRNISQAMFLEYPSLITDDPRVAAVNSEAYHCALSRAQQAGMDTFAYISAVFISQILPQGIENEHLAYRPLYILYGTDFTSRFIAFEALIKRHKFVTQ